MAKISIIMPLYNAESFVKAAIESILAQTLTDFELIIIDDGSQDNTGKIVSSYKDKRIRLVTNHTQVGVAMSLNIGLRYSQGVYIARMDGDDISYPTRLQEQHDYLEKYQDVALLGTWVEVIDTEGVIQATKKQPESYRKIKNAIIRYNPFFHSTVMIRKQVLDHVGGYKPEFNGAEDYELSLRIASQYRVANLPKRLLKYRRSHNAVGVRQMKLVEFQALRVRIHALVNYNYPLWQVVYLVKPFLMFLVPATIKRLWYRL